MYNVVADKLCDGARKGVAVPWRRPRHKTMRFAARGSERQWLRKAYGEVIDARLRRGSEDSVVPDPVDEFDCLVCEGVTGGMRRQIVEARCNRTRLAGGKRHLGVEGGKAMTQLRCPCGGGLMTLGHVVFDCCLPTVQQERRETAAAMEAARVSAVETPVWSDTMVAMQGARQVAGTAKEQRLLRCALGVAPACRTLGRRAALACGAKGTVRMIRAAEQAAGTE